jgi:Collagen triple helix repeat (20 copies)
MIRRTFRSLRTYPRRWWPTPSILLAGAALFIVLGGTAVAASGMINADDIAPGAVTGKAIRSGAVEPKDLSAGTRALLEGGQGATGARGVNGEAGTAGSNGANGPNGVNGAEGAKGAEGFKGSEGAKGAEGPKGAEGAKGTAGTNGTNGTIVPLSAKGGLTALPTGVAATTVVELAVPPGNYVVIANTQLFQTGAGDSVECLLKAGAATLDQAAMKTLPALASVPASLQAVTTTTNSPTTTLSVQCSVAVANGTASSSSLIAIPTA